MKYDLLSILLSEAPDPGRKVEKIIQGLTRKIESGKALPKGFVPFKELEKLIELEDKFQDAEDMDGGPNIEGGNADIVHEEGMKAAAKIEKKRKGEILRVENNGVRNDNAIRILIEIVSGFRSISKQDMEKTIQKYLIPQLGDSEFIAFGKPKVFSSAAGENKTMFHVRTTRFDVEIPIL